MNRGWINARTVCRTPGGIHVAEQSAEIPRCTGARVIIRRRESLHDVRKTRGIGGVQLDPGPDRMIRTQQWETSGM